jgi:ApaG protein
VKRIRRRQTRETTVYEAKTRDIVVRIAPSYLEDQSDPEEGRWFWAYTVEIENHGVEIVQLVSRHWIITDGLNRIEEVTGEGVVGEQPTLKPRDAFRYTSGCPLTTPSGTMKGTYRMVADNADLFEVAIPEFSLDLPGARRVVN